ncbi:uncharacterized protein RHOBADRAFT_54557, partial [Rhodotorula graminis WP1]
LHPLVARPPAPRRPRGRPRARRPPLRGPACARWVDREEGVAPWRERESAAWVRGGRQGRRRRRRSGRQGRRTGTGARARGRPRTRAQHDPATGGHAPQGRARPRGGRRRRRRRWDRDGHGNGRQHAGARWTRVVEGRRGPGTVQRRGRRGGVVGRDADWRCWGGRAGRARGRGRERECECGGAGWGGGRRRRSGRTGRRRVRSWGGEEERRGGEGGQGRVQGGRVARERRVLWPWQHGERLCRDQPGGSAPPPPCASADGHPLGRVHLARLAPARVGVRPARRKSRHQAVHRREGDRHREREQAHQLRPHGECRRWGQRQARRVRHLERRPGARPGAAQGLRDWARRDCRL